MQAPTRVLLVLSELTEAKRIASFLEEHDLEAVHVGDDQSGINILDTEQVDGLVCDTRAPRIDGMRLLRIARMRNPEITAILMATRDDLDLATRALDEGAHDFQTRPINVDKILAVLRRGFHVQNLVGEMHELARRLDRKFGFPNLIGNSAAIVRVYNRILQAAGADTHVLVLGESGTGRGMVAAAIHHNSARRSEPLVRVDCEGIDSHLLDADLFGVDGEGSAARVGRVERTGGGTLVLDDVDRLPHPVQGRLVRLLRDREFEREDGGRILTSDARIIAIGSLDLREKVEARAFRADLYDLLRPLSIEMPALRHRKRDIPLLVEHFLAEIKEETGRTIAGVSAEALDRLIQHDWPGNVRELKSVVRGMALTVAGAGPLDLSDLPGEIRDKANRRVAEVRIPVGASLAEAERTMIEATLKLTGGDRPRAARMLGIGLRTLQRRLKIYGRR